MSLLGAAMSTTSCNDLLDLDPVSQITPESFYTSADQLATYLNNYYSSYLVAPYSGEMYHTQSYSDGMARSDGNTDIMLAGLNGNTTLLPMTIGKFLREKPFRDTMEGYAFTIIFR